MSDSGRDNSSRYWLLLVVTVPLILVDQLTKFMVRASMSPGESIPVFWRLQLTYVQNTGSAFGLLVDQRIVLSIAGVLGVVVILLFYRFLLPSNRLALVAASLVLAGAIGNLIDRFALGFVTDFIDVILWQDQRGEYVHWPMFNIADSVITVGSVILVYFFAFALRRIERNRKSC
ncbi:MAG: signal peptidase II [Dehalococcoidia bacterium]|nr:signal peptidase II [Dehalococcoidia bacterium]